MTIKWNRESILVIITGIMILIGLFYYGNLYLVNPIQEETQTLSKDVETQQSLFEAYSPNEALLNEYEESYAETENFLPIGVNTTDALVTLEQLAESANVSITTVSRIADSEQIEDVSDDFAKNTYTAEMSSDSSANFLELINLLINEERVWNITALSYDKAAEDNYIGSFNFELFYAIDHDE